MEQIHRRFTAEQVKVLLQGYCQGMITRVEVESILGISKTRFFALLKQYRSSAGPAGSGSPRNPMRQHPINRIRCHKPQLSALS